MHGPGSYYSPTYPLLPYIDVIDRVALSLRPRKRKRWRRRRDAGLAMWKPTGLRLDVREYEPVTFVGLGEPDWPTSSKTSHLRTTSSADEPDKGGPSR